MFGELDLYTIHTSMGGIIRLALAVGAALFFAPAEPN